MYVVQGSSFLLGIALIFVYIFTLAFYRLVLNRLAKFPGPKLAGLSLWYEFWYDVVHRGQYTFKIKEMHEKYGPIVRISPNEIHINDPEFIPRLYTGATRPRDKYSWAAEHFACPGALIATVSHEQHRVRRAAMNRFFSKESVRRLQPILQKNLARLLENLEQYTKSPTPLNIRLLFSAFTGDTITEYCFSKSPGYLDSPSRNERFFQMMDSVHGSGHAQKHFNFIVPLVDALPASIVEKIDHGMNVFRQFRNEMRTQIRDIIEQRPTGKGVVSSAHATVFHDILDSNLPDHEKTVERLWQEAEIILIAGTETTAWTLSVITFYLLSNPSAIKILRAELEAAVPDLSVEMETKKLEQLPYLTAVIQEGLRLSFGAVTRLQRSSPDEDIIFNDGHKDWKIPRGTAIGMSSGITHLDERIFPDPLSFIPDRWLENPRLTRYLCSFSKGSRQCLGINLAYAELYLCVAGIFRRYGDVHSPGPNGKFELFETTTEDVEFQHDLFIPFPKKDSKGIRVLVD